MTHRILVAWAALATLFSVGTLGFALGQHAPHVQPAVPATTAQSSSDKTQRMAAAPPRYIVPEALRGIETEWRSRVGSESTGHAALFDPVRRRLIVERCAHPGYALEAVTSIDRQDCAQLVRGTISSLDDTRITLQGASGHPVNIALSLDTAADPPVLRFALDGHNVELIPGSRQDLFQAFEALPDIKAQKRAYLSALMMPAAGEPSAAARR